VGFCIYGQKRREENGRGLEKAETRSVDLMSKLVAKTKNNKKNKKNSQLLINMTVIEKEAKQ
jgi:hypothetical protein